MRSVKLLKPLGVLVVVATWSATAFAQAAPPATPVGDQAPAVASGPATLPDANPEGQAAQPNTRAATIEQAQADRVKALHPYVPPKSEALFNKLDTLLQGGSLRWHPFFQSAYSGGGFTLGAGYTTYLGGYNTLDVRGSYTVSNYKRIEAEYRAPRLFNRRADLSLLGGWRDAPQVGFYGIGPDSSNDDRTNYRFEQPYASGLFTIHPNRRAFLLQGGLEYSQWTQKSGEGSSPSVETRYTPDTLPGLGAEVNYLHTEGTVGFDWRTSPGYTRRGGYFGVTAHSFVDGDDEFGFQQVDYEAIQHIPILREAWVLSFRGRVQTAFDKDGQQIPFFMLPALGGGSSLRGYSSWRFRDKNSVLVQAEWRIMVNRYLDTAFFYDAGKVVSRTADIDLDHLKDDFGFGIRIHGPFSTPLRVEIAKSREGLSYIFSSSASF